MIRGLSLTQPWAQLVAIGAKRIETRSWSTGYRGLVAIHASKSWSAEDRDLASCEPFRSALWHAGYHWISMTRGLDALLPFGAIVAVASLDWVVGTPSTPGRVCGHELPPPEPEASFGDYTPGRFAWGLGDVRLLPEPIRCRGARGLWEVPSFVLAQLDVAGVPR